MLSLNNIKANAGSRKTSKRVGRGNGSKGTFSGRGMNGQNARSGGGVAPWFEGGQTPLFRRMPKLKGFSNAKFKKEYNIITFRDLELLASKGATDINLKTLKENKLIKNEKNGIKLLAKGELKSKFNIEIDKATAGAIKAVEKAGGRIKIIGEKIEEVKEIKEEKKPKAEKKVAKKSTSEVEQEEQAAL